MHISSNDRDILRRLAGELAEIAALPGHSEKAELWRRLNQLESPVRPLVYINEICWDEMNVDDELTCTCRDDWARAIESSMRMQLYQWRRLPGDMIVPNFIASHKVYSSTSMGLEAQVDLADSDSSVGVVSRHFRPQITKPQDIEKIKTPVVTADPDATERNYHAMCDLFGDIMPVRLQGRVQHWYAPWDYLITAWGVQEALIDMVDRPDMVNAFIERVVDCNLAFMDQLDELNLLALNNTCNRVGSGGYGYTDELPGEPYDPDHVHLHNQWGCATAQIFSEISPEMHWEFALRHEMRILQRFGLTYYGCCEPLDIKMDILRRIPNLRKISMSPWVDPARGAERVGRDYVYSHKPNPAILAENRWRPDQARAELRDVLEKTRGCNVEIILKDISTVRRQPQRLWQWAGIAMEETQRIGG